MNNIKGYVIKGGEPQEVRLNSLQDLYTAIGCTMVAAYDIMLVSGDFVTVWCDDEAMFKQGIFPMWELHNFGDAIIGNIVVTGLPDENGDTTHIPNSFIKSDLIKCTKQVILN